MSRKLRQGMVMGAFVLIVLALVLMAMLGCTTTPAPTTAVPTPTTAAPTPTAKPVTLIFESWVPTGTPANAATVAFGKGLEDATSGLVKTQYNVGGVMGPATDTFNNLIQGVADWAQFSPGYTPGIFPMSEIFELPIHFPSADILTKAMVEMYKKGYFDKEYAEVKFIGFYNVGPNSLFSNVDIKTVGDFAGLKIRCSSENSVAITKALGASPVSLPAPEIYTALQKGITDANWGNLATAIAFKLSEVTKYLVLLDVGTPVLSFGMNKAVYAALPESGKKYIDDNLENFSLDIAKRTEALNVKGLELMRQNNIPVTTPSDAEIEKMYIALNPIFQEWVDGKEAQGYPAKQALADLYQILMDLGVKQPFPAPK